MPIRVFATYDSRMGKHHDVELGTPRPLSPREGHFICGEPFSPTENLLELPNAPEHAAVTMPTRIYLIPECDTNGGRTTCSWRQWRAEPLLEVPRQRLGSAEYISRIDP